MARLTHTNGTVVTVSDDKVSRLLASGFTAAEDTKPATKPRAKRSTQKVDDTTDE